MLLQAKSFRRCVYSHFFIQDDFISELNFLSVVKREGGMGGDRRKRQNEKWKKVYPGTCHNYPGTFFIKSSFLRP